MLRRDRKSLLGLAAALVVALAVAAVILLFGIRRPPAFPSLTSAPDPTVSGWLLFTRYEADAVDSACLMVRAAGGGHEHKITCRQWSEVPEASLEADGRLIVLGLSDGTRLLVDPTTGATIDRTAGPTIGGSASEFDAATRSDGMVDVVNDWKGSARVIVHDVTGARTILRVSGPADYSLNYAWWSPDGKWVIADDSRGRYLLIAADGDTSPRILLSGEPSNVAWVQAPSS